MHLELVPQEYEKEAKKRVALLGHDYMNIVQWKLIHEIVFLKFWHQHYKEI